jgi:hypothetical protein
MTGTDLHVVVVDQRDPRLGRQVVHDPRSRSFPMRAADTSTWRSKTIRLYDPTPNPNQDVGCCTGCDKAMNGNAGGNRVAGRVLKYADALHIYSLATRLDPWEGDFNISTGVVDTGSSGLAASKAAQHLGLGGEYQWALKGGADAVVQQIMDGQTVGVGTYWYEGGFNPKPRLAGGVQIEMTGARVGGHQWRIRGYDEPTDMLLGRCWWGRFRDFWISREHLAELLADDGDAHTQIMRP